MSGRAIIPGAITWRANCPGSNYPGGDCPDTIQRTQRSAMNNIEMTLVDASYSNVIR